MTIEIYTQEDCAPCHATKRALDKRGIAYTEHDAKEVASWLASLGHTSSPVVVVCDRHGEVVEHWSGFRYDRIVSLENFRQ